ncbi:AAA family ATPase [candidate division KSB1 bacterium]|nr:AAA family ATPase [candidate division KSB1 bacterium]
MDSALADEIKEFDENIFPGIVKYVGSVKKRAVEVVDAFKSGNWKGISLLAESHLKNIQFLLSDLKKKQSDLENFLNPEKESELESELVNLKNKETLSKNKEILEKCVKLLKNLHLNDLCRRSLDTSAITRKNSELINLAVIKQLEKGVNKELSDMGINHLKLKMSKEGSKGTLSHKLQLSNSTITDFDISMVLSEGEQRVVALASFLAELESSNNQNGIVFDDPVSSLDHKWREKIAKRFVQESKKRQVIIFTHDIVFLFALTKEADSNGISNIVQTVTKIGEKIGVCDSEVPWIALTVNRRIGKLRDMIQGAEKEYKEGEIENYQKEAEIIYGRLRTTWEKAVEEVLFLDVITRFTPEIHTKKLKNLVILKEDYYRIERGMSKCSIWLPGHDQPAAMNSPFPEPQELKSDVTELEVFVKELRNRSAINN